MKYDTNFYCWCEFHYFNMYFILFYNIQVHLNISENFGNGKITSDLSFSDKKDMTQIKCAICFSQFHSISEMEIHTEECKKTIICPMSFFWLVEILSWGCSSNLRCLSQNIVPKGIKLNIKQFTTFQERKIICKTHRSILNRHIRHCNRIIDNLKAQINKIKTSIKSKCNYNDFIDVSNTIIKSKEKVFKITKNCQIKKFTHLQKYPKHRNTPVPDIIRKKWVIILSSKPLSDGEQSLLQKGPKFAVSSSKVPLTEYIAVTKGICNKLGENTVGKDCTEI